MRKAGNENKVQALLLLLAATLPAVAAVSALPLLARKLSPELMAGVSVILMLGALFGTFDVLRPVFVRSFVGQLTQQIYLQPRFEVAASAVLGGLVMAGFFVMSQVFFAQYLDAVSGALLSLAGLFFCLSIPFWSILESAGRVGLAQVTRSAGATGIYLLFIVLAYSQGGIISYAVVFFVVQIIVCVGFYCFGRRKISWGKSRARGWTKKQVIDTLKVNASKVVIDFADRLTLAKLLSPHVFAAYSMLYDVTSKGNIVPQYINAYFYPQLCLKHVKGNRTEFIQQGRHVLMLGAANAAFLMVLAFGSSLVADRVVEIYMGKAYAGFGSYLVLLLAVAGVYSLAFYGQSIARAAGQFSSLARAFNFSVIAGALLSAVGWYFIGVDAVLLMALLLKTPGVGLFVKAINEFFSTRLAAVFYLSVPICCGLMVFLVFRSPAYSIFMAAGIALISGLFVYAEACDGVRKSCNAI